MVLGKVAATARDEGEAAMGTIDPREVHLRGKGGQRRESSETLLWQDMKK